jgi:hypothetical protein
LAVLTACQSILEDKKISNKTLTNSNTNTNANMNVTPDSPSSTPEEKTNLIELIEDLQHYSHRIHPILAKIAVCLAGNLNEMNENEIKQLLFLIPQTQ